MWLWLWSKPSAQARELSGLQAMLQMRSECAFQLRSCRLCARSHSRSSPPKQPVARMLEGCAGFAELTRQQEMGRSEPNWELSTKRFYGKEDKEADAVLVPETLDLDLVLRQFLHVALLLLLFLQTLFATASSPI